MEGGWQNRWLVSVSLQYQREWSGTRGLCVKFPQLSTPPTAPEYMCNWKHKPLRDLQHCLSSSDNHMLPMQLLISYWGLCKCPDHRHALNSSLTLSHANLFLPLSSSSTFHHTAQERTASPHDASQRTLLVTVCLIIKNNTKASQDPGADFRNLSQHELWLEGLIPLHSLPHIPWEGDQLPTMEPKHVIVQLATCSTELTKTQAASLFKTWEDSTLTLEGDRRQRWRNMDLPAFGNFEHILKTTDFLENEESWL